VQPRVRYLAGTTVFAACLILLAWHCWPWCVCFVAEFGTCAREFGLARLCGRGAECDCAAINETRAKTSKLAAAKGSGRPLFPRTLLSTCVNLYYN